MHSFIHHVLTCLDCICIPQTCAFVVPSIPIYGKLGYMSRVKLKLHFSGITTSCCWFRPATIIDWYLFAQGNHHFFLQSQLGEGISKCTIYTVRFSRIPAWLVGVSTLEGKYSGTEWYINMATNTDQATKTLNTIEEALAAFRDEGKFAIVVVSTSETSKWRADLFEGCRLQDDFDRENEGDLIMPSEIATKEVCDLL